MFISKKTLSKAIDSIQQYIQNELFAIGQDIETKLAVAKADQDNAIRSVEERLEAKAQELFQKALEADREKRYKSEEPFVEIVSQDFTEEGGVQLRLDWNPAFIRYLKANGVIGPTDEAIVDNWLKSLSQERLAEGGKEFR